MRMNEGKFEQVYIIMKSLSIIYTVFGIGLLLYFAGTLQNCSTAAKDGTASLAGEYMGTQNCVECHVKEYKDWLGSHHDLSMQEANDSTVLGDFNNSVFENKGITSRFFKKDGKFFVNTEGVNGEYQNFEIEYAFGVTPLQQYMISLPGGRLQCLHITWDSEKNKWFDLQPSEKFAPDDWMHWTKGSMTWNTMCADCHSTYLEKNYFQEADSFHTTWEIINVSCEACHGPAKKHVEYVNSKAHEKGERVKGSYMYQTADLSSKELTDQCARCHAFRSQFSEVYDHSGHLMDHYVPEVLRPGMYHSDGQILEEVYVYGSFLQSKMYQNNVGCTDCHDAHSMRVRVDGNPLCIQCHIPNQYDTPEHHFHEDKTDGALCINCHMPGKYYMGNDYRRDHSFRVPRPDQSVKYGTPNACNQCHEDQTAQWSADAIVEWYGPKRQPHYSDILTAANAGEPEAFPKMVQMMSDTSQPEIVRATAIWHLSNWNDEMAQNAIIQALKDTNDLIRHTAVGAMNNFSMEDRMRYLPELLNDSIRAIRAHTAYALAEAPGQLIPERMKSDLDKAMKEYEGVLAMQADFPTGQMMQGQYYHKKGDMENAEKAYLRAIQKDPYLSHPQMNLANLYYNQGRMDEAEKLLKQAVEKVPEEGEAHYMLGLLLAEKEQLEAAESHLAKAAKLTGNPRHYYNWALTLQHLEKVKEAEGAFLEALKIDPYSVDNIYALAILYIQQKNLSKARPLLEELLKIQPDNPQLLELMQTL